MSVLEDYAVYGIKLNNFFTHDTVQVIYIIKFVIRISHILFLLPNSFHGIQHFSNPTLRAILRLAILMFHHFEKLYK